MSGTAQIKEWAGKIAGKFAGHVRAASPLLPALFFPAAVLHHELLLRAFDRDTPFGDPALVRIVLFSAAAGLLVYLLLDLLPKRPAARIAGCAVLGMGAVLFCVERGCRVTFGLYYGVTFMGHVAGNAFSGFRGTVFQAARDSLSFFLLSLVPLAAFVLLRKKVIREEGQKRAAHILLAAVLAVCQLAGWGLSAFGSTAGYYTYDFAANTGIPRFGLLSSVRLEPEYAVMGTPAGTPAANSPAGSSEESTENSAAVPPHAPDAPDRPDGPGASEDTPQPLPSEPNTLDIDFAALAEAEPNRNIQDMH